MGDVNSEASEEALPVGWNDLRLCEGCAQLAGTYGDLHQVPQPSQVHTRNGICEMRITAASVKTLSLKGSNKLNLMKLLVG